MEQEILIYVDDKEKYDASAAANSFADKNTVNRVYINTLGAELVMKYLKSENISVDDIKNIHSVKKVLEHFDISDIMLENIHIDVRVVFDEKAIFIPKSHFEYNILPDIYLVLLPENNFSDFKLLGFFEPKLINKNNANKEYYFIEKEKLTPPINLINYINSQTISKERQLSENIIENAKRIMISMADNDVTKEEQKYLLTQLIANKQLRELYIEYENFETLSYQAANDSSIERPIITAAIDKEFGNSDDLTEISENISESTNDIIPQIDFSIDNIDAIAPAIITDEILETQSSSDIEDNFENIDEEAENIVEEIENINEENVVIENIGEENIVEEAENFVEGIGNNDIEDLNISENIDTEYIDLESNNTILQDDAVSLDNIENISAEPLPEETSEKLSISDVNETEPIEEIAGEKFSIDNIELPEEVSVIDAHETINLDNIPELEPITEEETSETLQIDNAPLEETSETWQAEDTHLEETPETLQAEDTPLEETTETWQAEDTHLEETPEEVPAEEDSEEEIISHENNKEYEEYSDKFGKNLLENLSTEDVNNISAEENDDYSSDISPDELLSQIDNALNSAINNSEEDTAVQDIPDNNDAVIIEDTAGLDALFEDNNMPTVNTLDEVLQEETPQEEISTMEQLAAQQSGQFSAQQPTKKNNPLPLILTAIVAIALAAGAFFYLKPKYDTDSDIEPVRDETPVQEKTVENILENNTPEDIKPQVSQETIKEVKNNPTKPVNASSLSVNKIVWDAPNDLSYSSKFQNYLKMAGKSIKLSLTADLLLSNEYAYANQVKIGLTLSPEGSIQDIKVVSGSGSSQIDNIVLQSVKDTLNVIKPPREDINSSNFKLNITIYF